MSFWDAAIGGFLGGATSQVTHAPTEQTQAAEKCDYVAAEAIRQEPDSWAPPPWTEIIVPHPHPNPPPLTPPNPGMPPNFA